MSVREPVKEVVMTDSSVCMLLHSGTVSLLNRLDLSEKSSPTELGIETTLEQIYIRQVLFIYPVNFERSKCVDLES